MKQVSVFLVVLISIVAFKKESAVNNPVSTVKVAVPKGVSANAAKVAALADAFKAMLTPAQIASLQIPLTKANAVKWSNLPGGVSIRNGIEFSTLNAGQLAAAKAVIAAASGTTPNEGYDEFMQINSADGVLGQGRGGQGGPAAGGNNGPRDGGQGGPPPGGPGGRIGGFGGGPGGGGGYSTGKYIIAFLGTPALSGTWMLQFGGHHYAQNVTYSNGVAVSGTPSHQGVEPLTWTTGSTTFTPLLQEATAMRELLASMSSSELAAAKVSTTFSDLLLGAKKDGSFPATKSGIQAGSLNKGVKTKIIAAMMPWLNDLDDELKTKLLAVYTKELDDTYVMYSGNTNGKSGDSGSFFNSNTDYVRIDGPSVWIEFVCQNGVVLPGIHYHTIFRDHTRDYNGL